MSPNEVKDAIGFNEADAVRTVSLARLMDDFMAKPPRPVLNRPFLIALFLALGLVIFYFRF